MATSTECLKYIDSFLKPHLFQDYCPNGLQVSGGKTIKTLVTGVTACQALIDAAVEKNADALLVHHGIFWKNDPLSVTGMKHSRLKALLTHDINLWAYHLPLDAHPEVGNNAQLGKLLGFTNIKHIDRPGAPGLFTLGECGGLSPAQLTDKIQKMLGRMPVHIPGGPKSIKTVAWCSGGAQRWVDMAIELGADAYITGEISESSTHIAREENIHFFSAGHHATERYGVKALGEHLAKHFQIKHHFIDIDNPA